MGVHLVRHLRRSGIVLGTVVVLACGRRADILPALSAAQTRHGEFAGEIVKVGDTTREYRLVVPRTVDLSTPAALVVAFHGMLIDSKDVMPKYTRLNEAAEKHKFILAYPDAIGKSWGIDPAKVKNDLAFFDALLSKTGRKDTR